MTPTEWASRLNNDGATAKTATTTPAPSQTTAYFSRNCRRRESSTMMMSVANALRSAIRWTPLM